MSCAWHPSLETPTPPPPIAWWTYGESSAISSPNVKFVPSPPHGDSTIVYIDGRYGHFEFTRWPQELKGNALHRAWVRSPGEPHGNPKGDFASFRLQRRDFVPADGTQKALCPREFFHTIKGAAHDAVKDAVWFMSRTKYEAARPTDILHSVEVVLEKLDVNELSWREMNETIAEVQRIIMELVAYSDYRHDIETRWKPDTPYQATAVQPRLGGFTDSAYLAHVLFILGIPVWFRHNSAEGLDSTLRSYDVLYPVNYLELGLWPTDTDHTTTTTSAIFQDLSAMQAYPNDYTRIRETLRRPGGRPSSPPQRRSSCDSRSRSPPRDRGQRPEPSRHQTQGQSYDHGEFFFHVFLPCLSSQRCTQPVVLVAVNANQSRHISPRVHGLQTPSTTRRHRLISPEPCRGSRTY
jgi:hypothetical protein